MTIDRLVGEKALLPPDIVKIDVEGAEMKVLRGMEKTLARSFPKILLEVHSQELEQECLQFLAGHNYQSKIVDEDWLGRLWPEARPIEHNRWIVAEKQS